MGVLPDNPPSAIPADRATEKGGAKDRLPDYLPARMVNEFVYCPTALFLRVGGRVVPRERGHGRGQDPARAGGREDDGTAEDRRSGGGNNPLPLGDSLQRPASSDRQNRLDRGL